MSGAAGGGAAQAIAMYDSSRLAIVSFSPR
jgi:hypothetical protein